MPFAKNNQEKFQIALLKVALAELKNTDLELFHLRNEFGLNDNENVMFKDLSQFEQRPDLKKNKYFND